MGSARFWRAGRAGVLTIELIHIAFVSKAALFIGSRGILGRHMVDALLSPVMRTPYQCTNKRVGCDAHLLLVERLIHHSPPPLPPLLSFPVVFGHGKKGPCTSIFQFSFNTFRALTQSTTSLVSTSLAAGNKKKAGEKQSRNMAFQMLADMKPPRHIYNRSQELAVMPAAAVSSSASIPCVRTTDDIV